MIDPLFQELSNKLKDTYPKFRIVIKEESSFMKWISRYFLRAFCPTFMSEYTTTIGYTVYMPRDVIGTRWGYQTLRHEGRHVADYHAYRWLFSLSYLLALPIGLTMRSFWEFRGYYETMKVEAELTKKISQETVDFIVGQFTGPTYLFMAPWPSLVRMKIENDRLKILKELGHWEVVASE